MASHPFNTELDELVALIGEVPGYTEIHKFRVTLRRYDGGEVKVAIERMWRDKRGHWRNNKLGRLLPEEAVAIGRLLVQAADGPMDTPF